MQQVHQIRSNYLISCASYFVAPEGLPFAMRAMTASLPARGPSMKFDAHARSKRPEWTLTTA